MIVDDSVDVRELVSTVLEDEGYRPIPCKSGEAALARLAGGTVQPAVIIVDLAMPGMSGTEFIKKVRSSARVHTPVVLLSGWELLGRFGAEADRVISKPFETTTLVRAVDRLVGSHHARQAAAPASEG